MAKYTVSLSQNETTFATYNESSLVYDTSMYGWEKTYISPPKWNNGRKSFAGYYINNTEIVTSSGIVVGPAISSNKYATESWSTKKYAAVVWSNSSAQLEIVQDDGVWYQDYKNLIPLDATHPYKPTRTNYRFLGCFSTNSTTGTQYIDADGKPTAAFLGLTLNKDINIYSVWQKVSVTITVNSTYGTFAYKKFYQATTPDGDGKYGFFTDSTCTPESRIYGIPVPTRELYAWAGLRATDSSSGTFYVDGNGDFTEAFLNLSGSDVKTRTLYANSVWTQVSYKVTVDAKGGAADVLAYYNGKTDGGIFADWLCATPELQSLPIPARTGYRFLGYYSGTTSSATKYVDFDGTILSVLKTRKATTTINAQWRQASSTVTLDPNGGSGGGSLYFDSTDTVFFDATSATVSSVPVPAYTGNTFIGYFDAQTGGNQIISAAGVVSPSFHPAGTVTLYAQWTIGKSIVEIDAGEGTAAADRFYYDHTTSKFYADDELTEEITSVDLPVLRLFNTNGLFSEQIGGSTVVSASGAILPSFAPTEEHVTIYAQYTRRCFEMSLDADNGSTDVRAIYHAPSGSTWFSDDSLDTPISNVGVPVRTGYTFGGFYYDGTKTVDADGTILPDALVNEDYTASAQWTAKTYTLTFNAYPGTPSFSSKTVTFNAPIGAFPTVTIAGRRLDGWTIDGAPIEPTTVWTFDAGKTANANWHDGFGGCTDFFQLETANGPLMLVASNPGSTRTVIETSHTGALAIQSGDSSVGAFKTFGLLMNPVCTYRIRKEGRVTINLGSAWSGSGTKSGYMLVNAEYATAADGEPVLVVRGAANEGANAVNRILNASRWSVNLDVNPDHIAQDPMNAVNGGGELTECKTLITCDPVVPMENGMPCASDIVHGKVIVTATTNAYGGENAPTARSPFIETNGVPPDETDVDFTVHAFTAERSL